MYSWMFLKAKLWVNDQEIMVMSNQEPIYVSDGQRHKIVVTLGKVEDNILKSNTVVLTVDGKHAEMEVSFWDKDGLEAMDPFLGGLPPENYQPYTGQYYLFYSCCIFEKHFIQTLKPTNCINLLQFY